MVAHIGHNGLLRCNDIHLDLSPAQTTAHLVGLKQRNHAHRYLRAVSERTAIVFSPANPNTETPPETPWSASRRCAGRPACRIRAGEALQSCAHSVQSRAPCP